MPRGVPVSTGPAVLQGKVDHRPQQHRRGQGVLAGKRFGGRRQNFVVISSNFFRAFEHKVCRSRAGQATKKDRAWSRFGDLWASSSAFLSASTASKSDKRFRYAWRWTEDRDSSKQFQRAAWASCARPSAS